MEKVASGDESSLAAQQRLAAFVDPLVSFAVLELSLEGPDLHAWTPVLSLTSVDQRAEVTQLALVQCVVHAVARGAKHLLPPPSTWLFPLFEERSKGLVVGVSDAISRAMAQSS